MRGSSEFGWERCFWTGSRRSDWGCWEVWFLCATWSKGLEPLWVWLRLLCFAGFNARRTREFFGIKENLKSEISSKNLVRLKIRESFLSAMPEKHWLIIRDMKNGFHEDPLYVTGSHGKAFQLMILLRTESTQKHALIQYQYLIKKHNITVLYSLGVLPGYTLEIVTVIQISEKKRSLFQFLDIQISSSR